MIVRSEPSCLRWALLWRQRGERAHMIFVDCLPALFRTRREAREYASKRFGYIKHRPDLRCTPHCWRMPIPVRVKVAVA